MDRLTVSGPDHGQMTALWAQGNVFSKIIPQPETFSEKEIAELEEYGRSTFLQPPRITAEDAWWWWRIKNWGIKWDVDEAEVSQADDKTVIQFVTPWSPPTAGLLIFSALYPDLRFVLVCCEPSMHYAAETVFFAGKVLSDNCYGDGQGYQRIAAEFGCEDEDEEVDEEVDASQWQQEGL
jgi:hypothetical protein